MVLNISIAFSSFCSTIQLTLCPELSVYQKDITVVLVKLFTHMGPQINQLFN